MPITITLSAKHIHKGVCVYVCIFVTRMHAYAHNAFQSMITEPISFRGKFNMCLCVCVCVCVRIHMRRVCPAYICACEYTFSSVCICTHAYTGVKRSL